MIFPFCVNYVLFVQTVVNKNCDNNYILLLNLPFICPCIMNIFPSYNQQDATFLDLFISTDAVHVSGGSSTHHQEHKTVQYSLQVLPINTAACC